MAAQARGPIFGLVPQRHLEDHNMIGVSSGTHNGLLDACEVNVGYTLWRNPEARSDLADLGVLPAVHVNHILLNQPRRAWSSATLRRSRWTRHALPCLNISFAVRTD